MRTAVQLRYTDGILLSALRYLNDVIAPSCASLL